MNLTIGAWVGALVAVFMLSAPAWAAPLQPVRPVSAALYSGRWYEIARTPNRTEAACKAFTTDFSGWAEGKFSAVETCHKAAPGDKSVMSVHGRVLPQSMNAKMQLAILGGLIAPQYWILDHAADDAWLIMSTPNGHYVWLLARQPALNATARAAALSRLQSFGFDLSRLSFLQQAQASR